MVNVAAEKRMGDLGPILSATEGTPAASSRTPKRSAPGETGSVGLPKGRRFKCSRPIYRSTLHCSAEPCKPHRNRGTQGMQSDGVRDPRRRCDSR